MDRCTFACCGKSPATRGLAEAFCARLRQLTGLPIVADVVADYATLGNRVVRGTVDIAWTPPLVAMDVEDRGGTVLAVVKRPFAFGYHSALIVREDSALEQVEDLRGASAAWVTPQSASGYVVPRWQLRAQGIEPRHAFGREVFLFSHEAVARAVWDRDVEVGATHVALDAAGNELVNAPWFAFEPGGASLRVLLLVGPIPADVIAVRPNLPLEVRQRLLAALVALVPSDPGVGELFDATSFEPASEGHLALLRHLARNATEPAARDPA